MGQNKKDPGQEYTYQLEGLRTAQALQRSADRRFVSAKLSLIPITLIAAIWLVKFHPQSLFYLLIPVVLFGILLVYHERVLRALRQGERLIAYYERGLERLRGEWIGKGNSGEQFLDFSHPYARDLDIFGEGGLFELLCLARTRAGEQILADWLLKGAAPEEIRARQEAVRDLQDRLILREVLATAGEDTRIGVHSDALIAWGESQSFSSSALLRYGMLLLAVLWIGSIVYWQLWGSGWIVLLMSAINGTLTYRIHRKVDAAVGTIEQAGHDLEILSAVLSGIEAEKFSAAKLRILQTALETQGLPPSRAIAKLEKKVDWLLSRDNWMVKILEPFIFWTPQCLFSIEKWRAGCGRSIRIWLSAVGEIEALSSLASYAFENPGDEMPSLVSEGPVLEAEGFAHPLLPRAKAVSNDIHLGRQGLQMIMISGPNMAGKSTFLRGLGVNVVLAQAGAPVRAARMMLSPLAVTASICVLDSLQGGLSRFYAEIKRLKQISDMSGNGMPVLFLFDELLSGTNSHDRRVGTESILRSLLANGAIGLVTTHDLALTKIAESIGEHTANFHFTDTFENGELRFDYKLHPGVVQTTNALTLMRSIGLRI